MECVNDGKLWTQKKILQIGKKKTKIDERATYMIQKTRQRNARTKAKKKPFQKQVEGKMKLNVIERDFRTKRNERNIDYVYERFQSDGTIEITSKLQ